MVEVLCCIIKGYAIMCVYVFISIIGSVMIKTGASSLHTSCCFIYRFQVKQTIFSYKQKNQEIKCVIESNMACLCFHGQNEMFFFT